MAPTLAFHTMYSREMCGAQTVQSAIIFLHVAQLLILFFFLTKTGLVEIGKTAQMPSVAKRWTNPLLQTCSIVLRFHFCHLNIVYKQSEFGLIGILFPSHFNGKSVPVNLNSNPENFRTFFCDYNSIMITLSHKCSTRQRRETPRNAYSIRCKNNCVHAFVHLNTSYMVSLHSKLTYPTQSSSNDTESKRP